jgi:hypothetical protein
MSNEEDIGTKQRIVTLYLNHVVDHGDTPSAADFVEHGITKDRIKYYFGNMTGLHEYVKETHTEQLKQHITSTEDLFAPERRVGGEGKKRFVVTTAVADAKADLNFLGALKSYASLHDAQLVIMPCEAVTNSFEKKTAVFDKEFSDPCYMIVSDDIKLNDNFTLCSIQVSAKQIKPITGLARFGSREGSYVFAAPKQFLEYVPSGNQRDKNYAIMTPGACTLPSYFTEQFVSKRLSYMANQDHTIGAIIVEVEDDKTFHFRQVQAAEDGSFCDLGVQYNPDGSTLDVVAHVVLGDIHSAHVDEDVLAAAADLCLDMEINNVFLHDIFDGTSISHHIKDIFERAERSQSNLDSLAQELIQTAEVMQYIYHAFDPKDLVVVKSNHDEFLDRYVKEGRYVEDPENHYLALRIALGLFTKEDILKRAFEQVADTVLPEYRKIIEEVLQNTTFLDREATVRIGGVECASHGDLGINGAKASLTSLEKIYGNCVTGHAHSAAIQRGVFRVGTMSRLDLGYNRGPSTWTHTFCLVYDNGQRQLINVVGGKCRG